MNTYAVVESGGKQYKVEVGSSLLVDRLSAKQGDKVALRAVMFRDKERPEDQGLQIQAEEGLPAPRRPPLRADQARGDRGQAGDGGEETGGESIVNGAGQETSRQS